jgi:hypothetical protein
MSGVVFSMISILFFQSSEGTPMETPASSDFAALRQARIVFGHQSVGANILQGIRELSEEAGTEKPHIAPLGEINLSSGTFVADVRIGENGDPASKCADFREVVERIPEGGVDIALMKFCYSDFAPDTNIPELFNLYRRTVDSLRKAHPKLTVVHCTTPLTTRTPAWKRFIKWVLGRTEFSDKGNAMRQEYNELLRQEYRGEPLLDLAAFESTLPDGSRCSFEYNGKLAFALADEYTSDGGHLNRLGRRVVATEFVKVFSRTLRKDPVHN